MGNLLICPPPPPTPPLPCVPICMNSLTRGRSFPHQETWWSKCRTLSFSLRFCVRWKRVRRLSNGSLSFIRFPFALHVTVHFGDAFNTPKAFLQLDDHSIDSVFKRFSVPSAETVVQSEMRHASFTRVLLCVHVPQRFSASNILRRGCGRSQHSSGFEQRRATRPIILCSSR